MRNAAQTEATENDMLTDQIVDGQRFASYGNCVINTWAAALRAPHLEAFDLTAGKVAKRYPDGIVFFVIIEQGSPLLDAEQRKDIEAVYARWAPSMRAVAQVVEGGNLWSVTIRSLMTAIRLVQRRPYPTRVFTEVREGAEWIAPHLIAPAHDSGGDIVAGLVASITQLRSA